MYVLVNNDIGCYIVNEQERLECLRKRFEHEENKDSEGDVNETKNENALVQVQQYLRRQC